MINWKLLYDKFGRLNAAKKFEDLALDYVCDVYNEYTWKPTQRTRDGNRDFHNLEEDLLKIWGEAKYKKDSISLTRKDLDPTILSGLIDGHVELSVPLQINRLLYILILVKAMIVKLKLGMAMLLHL